MEPLIEALAEVVLQVVVELLFALGGRWARRDTAKAMNPWLAAIGYVVLGAGAGGISVLVFPSLFLKSSAAIYITLLLAPIAAGVVMAMVGSWRRGRGRRVIRMHRFTYAWLFAVSLAIVRLLFCD